MPVALVIGGALLILLGLCVGIWFRLRGSPSWPYRAIVVCLFWGLVFVLGGVAYSTSGQTHHYLVIATWSLFGLGFAFIFSDRFLGFPGWVHPQRGSRRGE